MSALRLLLFLFILTAIYTIGLSILAFHGGPERAETTALLWTIEFQTLLAIWVRMDRRRRNVSLPFEFDAFVFFGWPLALPYYLYRTRGRRGLAVTLAVYMLEVAPAVVSAIVRVVA